MTRAAPEWLADLEARFGSVIRTPLDRSTGTLTATPSAYDPTLTSDAPADRLAVYNRQYWFRLFDVLQTAYPLTTRLLGHWTFNEHAARFLLAHPPKGWDLDRAADGFDAFLAASSAGESVVAGARIDGAWRRVFAAPETPPFRPSAADAEHLLDSQLLPSPAVAIVEEHWPLLELRRKLGDDPSEAPLALPPRSPRARSWALVRRSEGIGQLPLEPREAELFALLARCTVRDALAAIEVACDASERADLPDKTRAWLARSVELDFWAGLSRK